MKQQRLQRKPRLSDLCFNASDKDREVVISSAATMVVRFVDPKAQRKQISKNDPGVTIFRQGKSVDAAVGAAFASGLLTLSEIAFDRDRGYAVFTYGFVCGGLCGHGETVVFEKQNGQWRRLRACSMWMA